DWSKAFDFSAPASSIRRAEGTLATAGRISASVGGETRQDADLADMIWPVADVIAYLSRAVALAPGDVVMTGTPAGVGPLAPGDRATGAVEGVGRVEFTVEAR
ncbi:MAG: fumarylacetoacetate hydrolase family protein, partial [Pseudomonadota bacterium]